jgi:TRAP-type C4-dicarboxylate transport system substrate-binding protein
MSVPRCQRRTAGTAVLAAILLAALAPGCGSGDATKAGKADTPSRVVLRAAGFDEVPAAEYFRKRVAQLSHGALRVEIVDSWDNLKADREQHWVSLVADGTADLGWVNTWAFDTLGVTSFRALTAPMLVDSYPLEQAVLASDIPAKMLPGLAALEVTGLALLADELRKPVAVKQPLLRAAGWRDVKVSIARSRVKADALDGLGAVPVPVGWDDQPALLRSGTVQATETNLRRYSIQGLDFYAPYVTQNVNLWPGVIALIANPDRLARLSDDQRAWLDQAAKEAAVRATGLVERAEPPLLASLCKRGARFAMASPAQLAALRDAFAPALQRLDRDPETKAFLNQIRRLKRSTPDAAVHVVPRACRVRNRATS